MQYFHELKYPKVRKETDFGFGVIVQMGSKGTKVPTKIFKALAKILSTQIYILFCFNTEVSEKSGS